MAQLMYAISNHDVQLVMAFIFILFGVYQLITDILAIKLWKRRHAATAKESGAIIKSSAATRGMIGLMPWNAFLLTASLAAFIYLSLFSPATSTSFIDGFLDEYNKAGSLLFAIFIVPPILLYNIPKTLFFSINKKYQAFAKQTVLLSFFVMLKLLKTTQEAK